ncbi:GntR family transcriptional regulator [Arthrobacter gengyunqii]|uniref:GntR family transcriptional regulator n=1 Tax=Arthrobacter gengyunqii TaxID=2886940 RepID=A0A9X1M0W9_9MICC|nr:GntR family transcriptional regulator [Arthrobacter gengyunqii]MCC3269166.1 GntR family transcriptional regulator [Arthrobacter gengyunqii]UOY94874.1 GntR family transcriptional regulator [Arthrobacter gengyunqii]
MSNLVTAPSLTDQVYNVMVNDICSGKLPTGTRLRQEVLADEYQVSRQPIQQALMLLRSQGFVREVGRRGLEVAPMSLSEVDSLYKTRAVIDGFAARSAAENANPNAVEEGRLQLMNGDRALANESLSMIIAADIEFHQFVASLSNNKVLEEIADVVLLKVRRVMGEIILLSGFDLAWDEHERILEAIHSGDGDLAEKLARQHADRGRNLVLGRPTPLR